MRQSVLLALVVAAFVGIGALPEGAENIGGGSETLLSGDEPGIEPAEPSRDAYAAWVAGATELARAPDGHFYADATVDGASLEFLVDTGASVVALTGTDARKAGLVWSAADVRPVARGASGPVHGVEVSLDRVTLGGHEARNVRAVIVPDGLAVSLLGQSFLTTIRPVRIEDDRMVLGE